MRRRYFSLLLALLVGISSHAGAESMKLWDVNADAAFWREHPHIRHEEIHLDPWMEKLAGMEQTQADVVLLRSSNDEWRPLRSLGATEDLSASSQIVQAVGQLPDWLKKLVADENGRIAALPVRAYPRPFYWYEDAWKQAGFTETEVPESFVELLDFLDCWAERKEKKGVCASRLLRWNTGTESDNYAYWLMEFLLLSHELQQRYAQETVCFSTPAFVALAERVRQTGQALYASEPRQNKRSQMLQLFQSDIRGGEHANNGRSDGLSHAIPFRLANNQPALMYANVELVFLRRGTPWKKEGIELLEHLLQRRSWVERYTLDASFEAGDYPLGNGRTLHVDSEWLEDYYRYPGVIVCDALSFRKQRNGETGKEKLMMQFFGEKLTAEEFARGLDELIH